MTFAKFGEVVDVYIATKKDARKKTFAFVRIKKMTYEYELEKALQGVKYGGRTLDVNIAMFERKPADGPSMHGSIINRAQKKKHSISRSYVRKNRSYATVVAEDHDATRIPPPPPQNQLVPIRLSNDSPT